MHLLAVTCALLIILLHVPSALPLCFMSASTTAYRESATRVIDALNTYKQLHGSLSISSSFKVPNGSVDWPAHTWGMPLGDKSLIIQNRLQVLTRCIPYVGRRVVDVRSGKTLKDPNLRNQLDSLGFIWKPTEESLLRTVQGIQTYSRIYPGRPISAAFTVPSSPQSIWPQQLLGYRLGTRSILSRYHLDLL